jgi:beta-glucosidase
LKKLHLLSILLGCHFAAITVVAQAPLPDSPAIEARARALLAKLTLEQKIELLSGTNGFYTRPMPMIGLPSLKMSGGPMGVNNQGLIGEMEDAPLGASTAFAAGVGLAATWDRNLVREVGEAMGRDARARGIHVILGSGVNIARSPLDSRNFEYLSEDPFLNSEIVVPLNEGIQSQGVIATVKHYALNNQEFKRFDASSDVDERTMREIYLPAFEAAVTRAHTDAVMCSYNLVNGVHASENSFLNLKVLKGDWGFQGVLMSDWYATHNGVAAATNGLDLEMPEPLFMNAKNLLPAIQEGLVKESTIDDKVLRLLRLVLRYRFLDRPQLDLAFSTYSVSDRTLALQNALEGITLLKNSGELLPLDSTKIKTIAVIGPDAYPAVTGGGGSSWVRPFDPVSILTGIANLLGPNVCVLYSRGLPSEPDGFFAATKWASVKAETFANRTFTGTPEVTTPERIDGWKAEPGGPEEKSLQSIRYTATFRAPEPGNYLLLAVSGHDDRYKVAIDGKEVIDEPHAEGRVTKSASIHLDAGQTATIVADYLPRLSGACFSLGMVNETNLILPEAMLFASRADVVVVAAGFDLLTETEGIDRPFTLPWGQDALINAMAAINPHTIVTLTAGGGVDTRRWLENVPVLLHTYYPGQEGGTAVADILFGKHNPEGKLPVSFDRSWDESPSYPFYYPVGSDTTERRVGSDGKPFDYTFSHIKYGDGLLVGYRYWTTKGKRPLFPFGFGLSYTTFSFSNLQLPKEAKSGSTVTVSFDVTNTGHAAGAEVAELYVSDPSAKSFRPECELKGFEKVRLGVGKTKRVILRLDARAFSYWSESSHQWTIDPGKFVIRVGDSSENTPLQGELTLQGNWSISAAGAATLEETMPQAHC